MNRIDQLFHNKKDHILSVYITAGYPELTDTVPVIRHLQTYGADMIEIGIPFSDPLADGPVIQESSFKALKNGMNMKYLMTNLQNIRKEVSIPLILMGYLNPILQYGFEKLVMECREIGIDGLIIPDLPLNEYRDLYRERCLENNIHLIMLITPHTPEDRIHEIVSLTGGFLYMVAEASTTGARDQIHDRQIRYFSRINEMNLGIPRLIGFGISSSDTFETACRYANGAIIGSAFINILNKSGDLESKIAGFMKGILTGEKN